MHDFVTLFIGHLENIGSLSDVDCPKVDIFCFILWYPNLHLSITTNVIKKKMVSTRKLSSSQIQILQNSNFCLNFITGKNPVSCFP